MAWGQATKNPERRKRRFLNRAARARQRHRCRSPLFFDLAPHSRYIGFSVNGLSERNEFCAFRTE